MKMLNKVYNLKYSTYQHGRKQNVKTKNQIELIEYRNKLRAFCLNCTKPKCKGICKEFKEYRQCLKSNIIH